MRFNVMLSGLLCLCFVFAADVAFSGDAISAETADKIVTLARDGKNVEAIEIYEKLDEDVDVSIVVMRSVAGCYWRERRFDKSRELYQNILDRRPTLHNMSDNPQTEPEPLLAKSEDSTDDEVDAEKSAEMEKKNAEIEAELKKLRAANAKLSKERDSLRKKTAKQIASVTAAAEESAKAAEELRAELEDTRAKRLAAEKVSEQIQKSMETQSAELNNKVADLETSLKEAREDVVASEKEEKGTESLLAELSEAQEKRIAAEASAIEMQKSLDKQKAELSGRVAELEESLKQAQEKAETAGDASKGNKRLLSKLEKAQEKSRIAEEAATKMKESVAKQKADLDKHIMGLEEKLAEAKDEANVLREAKSAEVERLQKSLESEQAERTKQEQISKEIQVSLEKNSGALRDQITSLEDKLQIAEMEVVASRTEMDKHTNENSGRVEELSEKIANLESKSNSARYEVVALSSALEAARLKNAELSAKRASEEDKTEKQMDEMSKTALSLALSEIDVLEREYEALDIQADERQYELLARIDALEQAAVSGETSLEDIQDQLDMERSLRKAMEEQGEKRDGMLLDANKLLAETTEKMAIQFDNFRTQMIAGKLNDNVLPPSDLAPMIGKLEDATATATREVNDLRKLLTEERKQHAEELLRNKNEIISLRRKVESLNQNIDILKAERLEQEANWKAEMDSKLAEIERLGQERAEKIKVDASKNLTEASANHDDTIKKINVEHDKRVAELGAEIAGLGNMLKESTSALDIIKLNLVSEQNKYSKLVETTSETEAALRKRISDLESAFSLPESVPVAGKVKRVEGSDPKLDAKVDDLYQSIINVSHRNKSLAITQYESLPAESEKPIELMKTIANLYRDKKNFETAYGMYEEILERDPGNLYAERKLVMTLFDLGRYDEALARLAGNNGAQSTQED